MSEVTERLKGLDEQEMAACLIAERALGAVAEAWDVDGRQGAVDAMLTLADGRRAAFEITNLAPRGALETSRSLACTGIADSLDILVAAARKSPRGQGRSVVTQMTSHATQRRHGRGY